MGTTFLNLNITVTIFNLSHLTNVTAIGGSARDAINVTSQIWLLPKNLRTWAAYTGNATRKLIVVPPSVTAINSDVPFRLWRDCEHVVILATTPPTITTNRANYVTKPKFYVPADSIEAYRALNVFTSYWGSRLYTLEDLPTEYLQYLAVYD